MSAQALPASVDHDDFESLPPNYSLGDNMLAGAFAGIAEHSIVYPLDLLKTRLQVIGTSPSRTRTGAFRALGSIIRTDGTLSLWRGLSSVIVGAGPAHAIHFATYETVKEALGGNDQIRHHPFAAATSGACATIASDAFMNPFDVVKQRMQVKGSTYRSMFDTARNVHSREGLTAFYVSYPTTLFMTIPFQAIQIAAYDSLSRLLRPTTAPPGNHTPTHLAAGALAGGLAAGLTTPLDCIKTVLQTRGASTEAEIRSVKGITKAASIIKSRYGYRGFFRGFRPRVITAMPSTAICWACYELAKAWLIQRNDDNAAINHGLS